MARNFGALIEEVEAIVEDRTPEPMVEDVEALYESIKLDDISESAWTPETSVAWLAETIEALLEDFEGGDEKDLIEYIAELLAEAYKWSYAVEPEEKDVTPDVGTVDEPPKAGIPRGFRGSASGLPPSALEWFRAVIKTMMRKPPKPIEEYPVEVSVEVWNDTLGKAINKGIGIEWKTDKKTGIQYPAPDYKVLYGMWKNRMAKLTGLRPTREKDQKMEKGMETHRKAMAKELAKGAAKIGKKRATQASTAMRGGRKKGKKSA
jgi:hypothetical protein